MRAILLWPISASLAYGMLSRWKTHGILSCPYCLGTTDVIVYFFFFSIHTEEIRHCLGTKKLSEKVLLHCFTGKQIEPQIDYYGVHKTIWRGNMPDQYGVSHNWHKMSIFWELPYRNDLLLRHNLYMMHIENNFLRTS